MNHNIYFNLHDCKVHHDLKKKEISMKKKLFRYSNSSDNVFGNDRPVGVCGGTRGKPEDDGLRGAAVQNGNSRGWCRGRKWQHHTLHPHQTRRLHRQDLPRDDCLKNCTSHTHTHICCYTHFVRIYV